MLQIIVNRKPIVIGQPLPENIENLEVTFVNMGEGYRKTEEKLIKEWFNKLINNCSCEWIEYNKCLMRIEDLTKFEL